MNPEVHAWLLGAAAFGTLVLRSLVLARDPHSSAGQMHAIFGITLAWWFYCMANVAIATTTEAVELFSRLAHIAVGTLPAITYHLHLATAGLSRNHQRSLVFHYAVSTGVTFFCLTWPELFREPSAFAWGPYPQYTGWGLVPVLWMLIVLIEIPLLYRSMLGSATPGSSHHQKTRALYLGNLLGPIVMFDFATAFGVAVYPFSFVVVTIMNVATLFGAVRYRIVEISPQIAAAKILATMADALVMVDRRGLIRVINPSAAKLFGHEDVNLIDQPIEKLADDDTLQRAFAAPIERVSSQEEFTITDQSGSPHVLIATKTPVEEERTLAATIWTFRDITALRTAEAENALLEEGIRQTQKLEMLGVMAGGVADDFNNLLMAILGSVELAELKRESKSPIDAELHTIADAAHRASELTNQLLTYAGRARSVKAPVDLNSIVEGVNELMQAAISKKVNLHLNLSPLTLTVDADASQLRQTLLNLVTNASESLAGRSGKVTITTGVTTDGKLLPPSPERVAAGYVFLEVTDTGEGMDAATRERIFEPFFTTKFTGRGLGLAMTLGIMRAHQGHITVDSREGQGTRVTVVLPAIPAPLPGQRALKGPADDWRTWRGEGAVLLADDEASIRLVARQIIEHAGFEVIEAANGAEALALFERHADRIRLMILDLTMPEMGGTEVFARVRALTGAVPAIFISGYADFDSAETGLPPDAILLRKPFTAPALIEHIRSTIGTPKPTRG